MRQLAYALALALLGAQTVYAQPPTEAPPGPQTAPSTEPSAATVVETPNATALPETAKATEAAVDEAATTPPAAKAVPVAPKRRRTAGPAARPATPSAPEAVDEAELPAPDMGTEAAIDRAAVPETPETPAAPSPSAPSPAPTDPAAAPISAPVGPPQDAPRSSLAGDLGALLDAFANRPREPNTTIVTGPAAPTQVRVEQPALVPLPGCASESAGPESIVSLFVSILLVWVLLFAVRRLRRRLAQRGLFPFILSASSGALRVALALLIVLSLARLFPRSLGPVLPWLVVSIAVGLGWALREPATDVFAWATFMLERRIRPGVWISGADFAGTVESVRLRSTTIRAQDGQAYGIENRKLLRGPLLWDPKGAAERELSLRVSAKVPSRAIRRAIQDAVLLSPYVHTGWAPTITQDPVKPTYWHVRARLLDPAYGQRFSGEVLERVEEILANRGSPTLLSGSNREFSIAPPR